MTAGHRRVKASRPSRTRDRFLEVLGPPPGTGTGLPMKLAFVTPRYGLDVIGGAESAARMLAERLAAQPGGRSRC